MPPLPDAPLALKVQIQGTYGVTNWANILYLKYTAGNPQAADLSAIAASMRSSWDVNLRNLFHITCAMTTITITDVSSRTGQQGTNSTGSTGFKSGSQLPANVACCVSKLIARRYRGGHPRMYLPGQVTTDALDQANWTDTYKNAVNAGFLAWYTAVNALTSASTGNVKFASVSYWQTLVPKTPPVLKPIPDVDLILGFRTDNHIDSMRSRLS